MKNPIKMDDLGGPPLIFRNIQLVFQGNLIMPLPRDHDSCRWTSRTARSAGWDEKFRNEAERFSVLYLGCCPLPVTVTTRIITCLVGDPYNVVNKYMCQGLSTPIIEPYNRGWSTHQIPVIKGGMTIPNTTSWSTLAHIFMFSKSRFAVKNAIPLALVSSFGFLWLHWFPLFHWIFHSVL